MLKAGRRFLLLGAALLLAAGSGLLSAVALGTSSADPPRTVTVDVGTGPQGPTGEPGPAGPTGPQGPSGGVACPTGYSEGKLVINAAHGTKAAIWTCLEN